MLREAQVLFSIFSYDASRLSRKQTVCYRPHTYACGPDIENRTMCWNDTLDSPRVLVPIYDFETPTLDLEKLNFPLSAQFAELHSGHEFVPFFALHFVQLENL